MRVRTKTWIAIIAVCVAATVYEIPNARLIWQCARTIGSHKRNYKDKAVLESVLTEEIIAAAPEAADILKYCLTDPNTEVLAGLVAKYPDNEFFLAQLAYKMTEANLIDTRAVPALADRLIALGPDNAHYRYMKGWILLKPPVAAGSEQEALEQSKQGNDLPEFTLPYSTYKQRVDRLSEKARIGLLDRRRAMPSETGWYWDLGKFILRSRGTYSTFSHGSFHSISAEVSEVAGRIIDHAPTYGSLEAGCLLLRWTEGTRLKELDLAKEQAQQVRFRLSQAIEINNVLQQCFDEMFAAVIDLMMIALVVTVAVVLFLPFPLPLVWIFVVMVNRLRGRAKNVVVGIQAYAFFIGGLAGSVGLAVLLALLNKVLTERFLGGLAFAFVPLIISLLLWLLARIRPVSRARFQNSRRRAAIVCAILWPLGLAIDIMICAFLVDTSAITKWLLFVGGLLGWMLLCAVVWGIVTYKHHVFRAIPYDRVSRNRLVQLVLILLLMTGVTGLLRPVPIVPWILACFAILFVGLVATHVSESRLICLDAMRSFFRKNGRIVVTRTKIARMMSAILLFCWVMILVAVHLSAGKWSRLNTLLTDPLSLYRPLPQATRETYEQVLSKKYSTDPNAPVRPHFREDGGLPKELYLASPEDLSAIIRQREAVGKPIREKMLINIAANGGHGIRPIVLKALRDPNALDVLITRAKWKDISVKEQLEQTFEEKMSKLAKTISQIRKDANSVESLIIRLRWGDETPEERLEQALEAKMIELSERVWDADNREELRSELTILLEMDSALPGSGLEALDVYEYAMMMEQKYGLIPPYGMSDPNRASELQKRRDRSSRVRQLVIDAKMPELLEDTSLTEASGSELLTSLFKIAGALAFISDPQEAKARFSRVLDLVAPMRDDRNRPDVQQSRDILLRAWTGGYHECLFYRSLTGVPTPYVTTLLKEYVQRRQLPYPFDELEFFDVFARAGDRELAEWIFQKVAESPPTTEVSHYPDGIPIGRPIRPSEVKKEKRREDIGYRYLEPTFPYLGNESIPMLLMHLGTDNDQLRAFIVWRVTSLGYEWPSDRLRELLKDSYWKVRLNVLFALDTDDLANALDDESAVVRIIAQMLHQAQRS